MYENSSSKKKTIVFMGAKAVGFQCLKILLQSCGEGGHEIIGVLTKENPILDGDSSTFTLCRHNGIRIIESLEEYLESDEFDILISVQYHQILKKEHLGKARQIAVNLHMAPLPEYRGCNQFSFAILDNAKMFGTTLHIIDEHVDSGPILFEKRFPLEENCWVDDLYNLTLKESVKLFQNNIKNILSGNYQAIPQDTLINERGSCIHYRNEINNIKMIDLNWSYDKIEKHLRATYMPGFEPPFTIINGIKVHLIPEK